MTETQESNQKGKGTKLVLSLLIDAAGLVSYFYPALGESIDLAWAPISSILIYALYKNYTGKLPAALGGFTEEIMPLTDAVPTATIMWFYTFVISKGENIKQIETK